MTKIRRMTWLFLVLLFLFLLCPHRVAAASPSVSYQTHVQNVGWQPYVKNGSTAGTAGRSLRLEGIRIKLANQQYGGSIQYRTHIQNIGWESSWKSDGAMSGTSGRSLRLEAIQIRLTGTMANRYDVYYRVHAQNIGWMGWAKNGQSAGTSGYAYRLEAIQIRLVQKGGGAPGSTSNHYRSIDIRGLYSAYIRANSYYSFKQRYVDIDGNGVQELLLVSSRDRSAAAIVCTVNRSAKNVVRLVAIGTNRASGNIHYNTKTHMFAISVSEYGGGEYYFYKLNGTKATLIKYFEADHGYYTINGKQYSANSFYAQSEALFKGTILFQY